MKLSTEKTWPKKASKNKFMKRNFVIVITGPAGSGKTTLAKMVSAFYKCAYISGDEISKKLFPDTYVNIEKNPKDSKIVEKQLLKDVKEIFSKGGNVVVDYIILGEKYISEYKNLFGKHLVFKVIFPPMKIIIERDKKRDCWTSGEDTVERLYKEYEILKPIIGVSNYIDNSNQTPEETFNKYFKN